MRRERKWAEGDRSGPYWFGMDKFVRLWDATLGVSYADFRAELSSIREDADDRSGYDVRVESWQPKFAEEASAPGSLMVGCDEDDWLDPRLPDVLRGLGEVSLPVRWDFVLVQGGFVHTMTHPYPSQYPHSHHATNYAIPTPVADLRLLTDHAVATEAFCGRPEVYLPLPLGVQIRTPASSSLLWDVRDADELRTLMFCWLGDMTIRGAMPPCYCLPLIDKVRNLCRRALGRGSSILMA